MKGKPSEIMIESRQVAADSLSKALAALVSIHEISVPLCDIERAVTAIQTKVAAFVDRKVEEAVINQSVSDYKMVQEPVVKAKDAEIARLKAQVETLREALGSYAECCDGCTCGDGWDHEIARAALDSTAE